MKQEAQIFKNWLAHDVQGKLLSNLVLFLVPWAKWAISRYCIYYWFANGYDPDYKENFFGLSEKLEFKGRLLELTMKVLFVLVFTNFLRAAYGDPGFVHLMKFKMPENILPDKYEKNCLRCFNRWKPPRAHHCRICTRCVLRMDHHCEWIGNCVGARNQKFFISFLFYTVLYALAGFGICLMNLILWLMQYGTKTKGMTQDGWATFNKILLAISSIFFILFAFDFLWEQMEAVLTNQTTVETYKHMAGRPGTFWEKMDKVFGSNRWSWFLPVTPKLELNALELLYYETEIEKNVFKEDELKKLPIYNTYAVN